MARTERRGLTPDGDRTWAQDTRDSSCRNPMCCGGEIARKARRLDRARLKDELRRNPEAAATRQSAKGRAWIW